ncbi:MAG: helix-turn-helix transcriptional regulator [Actinomycetota bacterium]|nr:helix-turn-helix transcriptional regulator [Actinomycetota bacterium]
MRFSGDPQRGRRRTARIHRLRALRAEAGLTLRELGLKVHVSDSSLSRYFTGQALPPWEVVRALADLGSGDPAELRRLWAAAQRERRLSRLPSARTTTVEPRIRPLVCICALMAASGIVGWALGRR